MSKHPEGTRSIDSALDGIEESMATGNREQLQEQKFFCDGCGLKSSVFYPKHEGINEVVYRLESRHNRLSPNCTVQVRQLRVVNE